MFGGLLWVRQVFADAPVCRDGVHFIPLLSTACHSSFAHGRILWAVYRGDECIGIAHSEQELIQECVRRGLGDDEYYVGWIEAEWAEVEEVEHGLMEFDDDDEPEVSYAIPPS
jgi:hypothetical protein